MILHSSTSSILHFFRISSPQSLYPPAKLLLLRNLSHLNRSFSPSSSSSSSSPVLILRAFSRFNHSNAAVSSDAENTFFADDAVSWTSLGLSDRLSRSLSNAGLHKPSLVQAESIPAIFSGKDVVVAAETGSGKTHSYLVPLIDKLCDSSAAVTDDSGGGGGGGGLSGLPRSVVASLVLCPNVLLCEQVVKMASGLRDDNGEPLLKVATVCGSQGWPANPPDMIVATPAALLNNIAPKQQRRLSFLRGVKYVVFDEADMLLCGGFQNQVIRLIHMLRFDEKQLSLTKNGSVADVPIELGSGSLEAGSEDEEGVSNEDEDFEENFVVEEMKEEIRAESSERKGWRRVRKIYERSKQYIFVAATLPVNGKKTAGALLKYMFPDANWVSGNYLHCHNPRLEQRWVEVTVDTQVDALIEAVNQGVRAEAIDSTTSATRTMVFANTVEAVEAVIRILETVGIKCYRYHKDCSLEERARTLVDFRENGGVFVCTDAAARGVDIPNISHVIQADFATSAVDFLHRIGRTARAGQYGLVTSLYTESNRDLVNSIRQAEKMGQPVESAFSRKRSFRNKLKKKRGSSNNRRDTSNVEIAMA
ncbi:hypothetical protein Tsubulata_029871 [Turnera subulata]|uniref:RNA helicase n=1 Tax=Turnera subulata TaxID=218843 RepID=A0A9Q0J108_9ROSI|nr:hypothetical protein Tsubulata_029871 [Turnera subulata]